MKTRVRDRGFVSFNFENTIRKQRSIHRVLQKRRCVQPIFQLLQYENANFSNRFQRKEINTAEFPNTGTEGQKHGVGTFFATLSKIRFLHTYSQNNTMGFHFVSDIWKAVSYFI